MQKRKLIGTNMPKIFSGDSSHAGEGWSKTRRTTLETKMYKIYHFYIIFDKYKFMICF